MDSNVLKNNWKQLKETVRARWDLLTEDDLVLVDGDAEYLAGALRQRYQWSSERAERETRQFLAELAALADDHPADLVEMARLKLAPGARKVREGLEELGANVRELARESAQRARDAAAARGDRINDKAHASAAHAREKFADLAGQAEAALERVERFVRERPFTSIGIAFLAGYLLFGRRR